MSSKGEQASTDIQIPCFGLEVKTNSYKITSIAFNFIKTTITFSVSGTLPSLSYLIFKTTLEGRYYPSHRQGD